MGDLTKMVEDALVTHNQKTARAPSLIEDSELFRTLMAMAKQIEHLEKRIKDAEDRHRRLLQALDNLPRP